LISKGKETEMEKFYIFSKLSLWETDLQIEERKEERPSEDVVDAIIKYSLSEEFYSPTLKEKIAISIN
jgi:hypothetical protein